MKQIGEWKKDVDGSWVLYPLHGSRGHAKHIGFCSAHDQPAWCAYERADSVIAFMRGTASSCDEAKCCVVEALRGCGWVGGAGNKPATEDEVAELLRLAEALP